MTELPEAVTLCMRCATMPAPVEGSERRECVGCGAEVWVSPASRQSIERNEYPAVFACMQCANEHAEGSDD